jgi:hypothetical protein
MGAAHTSGGTYGLLVALSPGGHAAIFWWRSLWGDALLSFGGALVSSLRIGGRGASSGSFVGELLQWRRCSLRVAGTGGQVGVGIGRRDGWGTNGGVGTADLGGDRDVATSWKISEYQGASGATGRGGRPGRGDGDGAYGATLMRR